MVYPLLALAVLAVVIVLEKGFVFWKRTRLPSSLVDLAETYGFGWDELERQIAALDRRNYFAGFFRVVLDNRMRPACGVEPPPAAEPSPIEKPWGAWLWVSQPTV